jgi:hypothetical protein
MKKKAKKYAEGGLAGLADTANALMSDVDNMANTINYGSSAPGVSNQPLGIGSMGTFKKGGKVKMSSASKRADGCAVRGKTRA